MLYKDIWRGPGGGQPRFDASQFLQECYAVCDSPRWALSVGWTTGTASLEPYSQGQVDEAVRSLQQAGQGRATGGGKNSAVTFPVSAYHAYLGRHNMRRLLDADPSYTLTVWGEVPTADCQRWLDEMRPEGRLFLDTKPPGAPPAAWRAEHSRPQGGEGGRGPRARGGGYFKPQWTPARWTMRLCWQ